MGSHHQRNYAPVGLAIKNRLMNIFGYSIPSESVGNYWASHYQISENLFG